MTIKYRARPIEEAALKELRVRDDAGRECAPYADREGGAPLRCCLRPSETGERIALVSYAPLRRWAAAAGADPGAYDEQGPVFVHAEDCGGPSEDRGYPFARAGVRRTARRYSARGQILGGRVLDLGEDPDGVVERALDEAFADPEVALVHVRAAEYGCFQYEVRRPWHAEGAAP
ncbi:DUF1203 domain-containing protein [Streptomyces sp. AP-93]|uniref:DUF1203 domain-containing protein n=1 Tax=Streptomyces sp. AP-93 TaxID=2929048 RepID=UPI001FAFF0DE|nr:DUF1203 domain-containing protein [Streptomyces sp. AP-93]MCJ0870831.1 DUF1203 domain-containing protein [Streptomyces sp. AP-93]